MTPAADWRLRWLVEVDRDLGRLRTRLRSADAGDARRLRAMVAELLQARVRMRQACVLEADARAVGEFMGTDGPQATALALRLRGRPWTEALAGLPRAVARAVRRMWILLCQRILAPRPPATAVTPPPAASVRPPRPSPDLPAPAGSAGKPWIGRTRDLERTDWLLGVCRRAGLVAAEFEPALCHCGRRAGIAGYLIVRMPAPAAGAWSVLRRCGLRLIGPAPADG